MIGNGKTCQSEHLTTVARKHSSDIDREAADLQPTLGNNMLNGAQLNRSSIETKRAARARRQPISF